MNLLKLSCFVIGLSISSFVFSQNSILLFIPHEQTYYSEYIVMLQALQASGYTVDVRSSSHLPASSYMIPENTTIDATANTLSGSNYAQFLSQYENYFGSPWNAALNSIPANIFVNGRIQDIENMSAYKALVVVGGVGSQAYIVDGLYSSQGSVSSTEVRNAAEKLNALAADALISGKPVLGQCHGAGIPAHWRYPVPTNSDPASLGFSILNGSIATGFPEPATSLFLSTLNISYRQNDPVVVGSPNTILPDDDSGNYKIITTRDWYPQTIAHAARTLLNIIETYPPTATLNESIKVLIIHGGAVNISNCHYTNRSNDIPCNYGNDASNVPADYLDLISLLTIDSANDDFQFNITDVNITAGTLPFDPNNECSVFNYLADFDAIIFYKHWSTGVTVALQNTLISFADNGGGVIALHHGLYNDIDPGGFNKNILVNNLFNAESAMNTWSGNRISYNLFNTNYGHFLSTWGLSFPTTLPEPNIWSGNNLPPSANTGFSYFQRFTMFDEIYNNMTFVGSPSFGRGVNMITSLWSNDLLPSGQCHVSGFTKRFDQNQDGIEGKVIYLQGGESKENYNVTQNYGQIIRNALFWAGHGVEVKYPKISWVAESGSWNVTSNWNPVRLPRTCDEVVLPDKENACTITIPQNANHTIKSITLGNNVTLYMPNPTQLIIQN